MALDINAITGGITKYRGSLRLAADIDGADFWQQNIFERNLRDSAHFLDFLYFLEESFSIVSSDEGIDIGDFESLEEISLLNCEKPAGG